VNVPRPKRRIILRPDRLKVPCGRAKFTNRTEQVCLISVIELYTSGQEGSTAGVIKKPPMTTLTMERSRLSPIAAASCGSIIPPPRAWFDDDDSPSLSSLVPLELQGGAQRDDLSSSAAPAAEQEQHQEWNGTAGDNDPLRPKISIQEQDWDDRKNVPHTQYLMNAGHSSSVKTKTLPSSPSRRTRPDPQPTTSSSLSSSSTSAKSIRNSSDANANDNNNNNNNNTNNLFDTDNLHAVGIPMASPSLAEWAHQVLPLAARELVQNATHKLVHSARSTYDKCRPSPYYSELHSTAAVGYERTRTTAAGCLVPDDDDDEDTVTDHIETDDDDDDTTPRFSSLPWVDRQMVDEWRTVGNRHSKDHDGDYNNNNNDGDTDDVIDDEDDEFAQARRIVPMPLPRPTWDKSEACHECLKPFGPVRLRHHCRRCGKSFCQVHSSHSHRLVQYAYGSLPERVCDPCEAFLQQQDLSERLAWRAARWRDYKNSTLLPYFEIGLDSLEDAVLRLTKAVIQCAKAIPLGAQATVAVETVDVLRKYGLNGIYTIMLRQEFLAAADLLLKALGINPTAFPLSVHELAAASFYALVRLLFVSTTTLSFSFVVCVPVLQIMSTLFCLVLLRHNIGP
jgi:FYVE zinc finger